MLISFFFVDNNSCNNTKVAKTDSKLATKSQGKGAETATRRCSLK